MYLSACSVLLQYSRGRRPGSRLYAVTPGLLPHSAKQGVMKFSLLDPPYNVYIINVRICARRHLHIYTVKPPKRGHFGTMAFVLSSEVAPFLLLNPIQCV